MNLSACFRIVNPRRRQVGMDFAVPSTRKRKRGMFVYQYDLHLCFVRSLSTRDVAEITPGSLTVFVRPGTRTIVLPTGTTNAGK